MPASLLRSSDHLSFGFLVVTRYVTTPAPLVSVFWNKACSNYISPYEVVSAQKKKKKDLLNK